MVGETERFFRGSKGPRAGTREPAVSRHENKHEYERFYAPSNRKSCPNSIDYRRTNGGPTTITLDDVGPDVYLWIQTDFLVVGDSIIMHRHHASNDNYDSDDPQNQIGGIVPAFLLSGWLRHGMKRVVQGRGGTACHPVGANTNFHNADVHECDLNDGYHEKRACVDDPKINNGCLVFNLFGGFEGGARNLDGESSTVNSSIRTTRSVNGGVSSTGTDS